MWHFRNSFLSLGVPFCKKQRHYDVNGGLCHCTCRYHYRHTHDKLAKHLDDPLKAWDTDRVWSAKIGVLNDPLEVTTCPVTKQGTACAKNNHGSVSFCSSLFWW